MIPAYHAGYVVDASVGVKWFVRGREADRDVALARNVGLSLRNRRRNPALKNERPQHRPPTQRPDV